MTALSEKTHIPMRHLRALEQCEYHKLPEGVYRKAILKKILAALHVDPRDLIDDMPEQSPTRTPVPQWKERVSKKINMALLARVSVFAIIIAVIGTYLGTHIYGLMRAPELTIMSPQEGQVVSAPQIVIRGRTSVGATIHINGIEVMPNNTGMFEQALPLRVGNNDVAVVAKKKFGPKNEIDRSITFEPIDVPASDKVSLIKSP